MSDLIPRHLRDLKVAGFADTTIGSRGRLLRHADRHLPYGLDEADRDDLAEYLAAYDWSAWTRHTYDSHLRGYYRWAVELDELTLDPMYGMAKPKNGPSVPDPISDDELVIALQRSPAQPWRMAIMLCAYAGLRGSEAARLRREDVTRDHVRVRRGKGGRDALVETAPQLWEHLRDAPPGPLIRTARGRPMTGHYLINYQNRHWRAIGLPDVHLHRLRHWYGTTLLRNGADLRCVQQLMRHASIVSTQGYTLVVDEQRRRAIATLPTVRLDPGSSRVEPHATEAA